MSTASDQGAAAKALAEATHPALAAAAEAARKAEEARRAQGGRS